MTDDTSQYTPAELEEIRRAVAAEESARCPRCDVKMTSRAIGGGSFGLGYARKRDWLICPKCKRSALYDIKRGTRN
jgi:uncharacterized protein with PIN domain